MAYHRRNSYTVEFKILVVEWLHKNDHNIHKAAREFNIGRKLVREWEKKYNELLSRVDNIKNKVSLIAFFNIGACLSY